MKDGPQLIGSLEQRGRLPNPYPKERWSKPGVWVGRPTDWFNKWCNNDNKCQFLQKEHRIYNTGFT